MVDYWMSASLLERSSSKVQCMIRKLLIASGRSKKAEGPQPMVEVSASCSYPFLSIANSKASKPLWRKPRHTRIRWHRRPPAIDLHLKRSQTIANFTQFPFQRSWHRVQEPATINIINDPHKRHWSDGFCFAFDIASVERISRFK